MMMLMLAAVGLGFAVLGLSVAAVAAVLDRLGLMT